MSSLRTSPMVAAAAVIASASLLFPGSVPGQDETVRLSGQSVAVYNLAGRVSIVAGSGSEVVVTVRRAGADSDQLELMAGSVDTRRHDWNTVEALRVVYPADQIRYDEMHGQTQLRVRDDGTFWGGGRSDRGSRRVEISNRGGGLEASADLRIAVPVGRRVLVALGAGLIEATNVSGDLYLDTGSGNIKTLDTNGVLNLDTGSGGVLVRSFHGPELNVDTGSGSVTIDGAVTPEIGVDTGSGDVRILGVNTDRVSVDTGSGDVEVAARGGSASFYVDTGSGDVTISIPEGYAGSVRLETGSGRLVTDVPITLTSTDEDEIRGTIGSGGSAEIQVETGSGSIRLARS